MRFKKLMSRFMDQAGEGKDLGGDDGAAAANATTEVAKKAAPEAPEADKGVARPSDAEAKLLKDVMKQKARTAELEAELTSAKAALKLTEGIDLEKARSMLAEQEEAERKRAVAAGEFDRLTKQMGERHTTEKTTMTQQIEEANRGNSALKQQIAELTVGSAFTQSRFVADELTLTPSKARVIYGPHFEYKDGKVVGYDKPASASDRTVLVSAAGEPLSFEDAMLKIVEADPDRDQLIRSKMKSGAGSNTAPKGAKHVAANQQASLSSVDKITAGLKHLAKAT